MLEMLTKKRNKKRKGFTLVELIVVIAILGILMMIAVPRFQGFREQSAIKADQATGATIGKAAELYYLNNTTAVDKAGSKVKLSNLQGGNALIDNDLALQSDKYGGTNKNKKLKDTHINITITDGKAKITIPDSTVADADEEQLYPIPAEADETNTGGTGEESGNGS